MVSRHIQRRDRCHYSAPPTGTKRQSCLLHRRWPRSRSVGPAALFSLQLSYVLFMPFVARPALRGHRWQRRAEDNKGRCQLAPQDLAVDSLRWPQSGRGETVPGLPAGPYIFDCITTPHPPPSPCLEGFPLWGFGPSSPSQFLALFID